MKEIEEITSQEYKYGFTTDVETDIIPVGLSEDVVRLISAKKGEPEWLLEFRLKAYRKWLTMSHPNWAHLTIPEIDFQALSYYAAPKTHTGDEKKEIDPELMKTFDKLGIPLEERAALAGNMAVDAVMDSVSVKTTFRETLAEKGIIFCSISEAVKEYPELVQKYLGSVVPASDNFYAALNSAVFSDGSFVYYCACGNSVNDSDLSEGYTYDDVTKTITVKYIETTEETVSTIIIEECNIESIKLNFDGEIREFFKE